MPLIFARYFSFQQQKYMIETFHIQNESINAQLKDPTNIAKLTDRQHEIYELIKNGTINTQMLSEAIGVSTRTIKRELYIIRDMHLIKYVGSNKTGHW